MNKGFNTDFWKGKRVFVTGHTGFKGSWLCLWLTLLGAKVHGYALSPPTEPNLFSLASVGSKVTSSINDIRDGKKLQAAIQKAKPEIIFHLAAQALVQESYLNPVETYAVNVMGTVNLLESARCNERVRAIVNVTSDKCYENREWLWSYREIDSMGGFDPYSSSKGCSELITSAYQRSFFGSDSEKFLASVRAGNVVGGGDWAENRLVCDCFRALLEGRHIIVRNPDAIRPWQHVLEPLTGYLLIAQKLYTEGDAWCQGWNFGPHDNGNKSVEWVVQHLCDHWGNGASYQIEDCSLPHEASFLKLDSSKARSLLGWHPQWELDKALNKCVEWTKMYQTDKNLQTVCLNQIEEYMSSFCCEIM